MGKPPPSPLVKHGWNETRMKIDFYINPFYHAIKFDIAMRIWCGGKDGEV